VLSVLEAAPLSVAASVLPVTSPVDGSAGLVGSVGVTGSVGLVGLTGFSGLVGSVGLSGVEGVLSSPLLSPLLPSSEPGFLFTVSLYTITYVENLSVLNEITSLPSTVSVLAPSSTSATPL
jgi:hypothetical protein